VKYDYKDLSTIPAAMHHQFDYVVIDPPFVTDEVWELYAAAAVLLLPKGEYGSVDAAAACLQTAARKSAAAAAAATEDALPCRVSAPSASALAAKLDDPNFNPFASSTLTANTGVATTKGMSCIAAADDDKSAAAADDDGGDTKELTRMEVRVGARTMDEDGDDEAASAARASPPGKLMLTTIIENDRALHALLGVRSRRFRPSIPNLIYQYSICRYCTCNLHAHTHVCSRAHSSPFD
jgi:hypothetical protein